eukprot:Tamp_19752.p1 GENE.Tamp_19752~~Tamp_19752.p1  ORF type:complete len:401 (+),score=50.60 Tamp_19752:112-1203(+)
MARRPEPALRTRARALRPAPSMQRQSDAPEVDLDAEDVQKCITSPEGLAGGCADDKLAGMDEAEASALVFKTRAILLGVAALYGTNFGSIKVMQESLDPSTAALLRFTLALGALSPFLLSTPRALWKPGVDIGIWVALGYVVQGVGLNNGSSASTAAFLCSLAVVVCPLLDVLEGGTVSKKTWTAAALAVLGVAVLEIAGGEAPTQGDLWSLLQPIGFGIGFWKIEKVMSDFPGKGAQLTAIQLVVVWFVGFLWCVYDHAGLPEVTQVAESLSQLPVLASVAWTGFVTTALTVLLQTTSLGVLSSSETTVLYSTEPIWAAGFASVVLGEELGLNTFVGGALIIAACVSSSLGGSEDSKQKARD